MPVYGNRIGKSAKWLLEFQEEDEPGDDYCEEGKLNS